MNSMEKKRLEDQNYVLYEDAADWLGLTDAEREAIALRRALARGIRRLRSEQALTQAEAAERAETSQSRWVTIETGIKPSFDLMFRAYFALGGTWTGLAALGAPLTSDEKREVVSRPKKKAKAPVRKRKASSKA